MNVKEARKESDALRAQLKLMKKDLSDVNSFFQDYLSLARRFGLPENIMSALTRLQQLKITAMSVLRTIQLLEAASGPIGWITFLGSALTTGVMGGDLLLEVMSK